ncbi:GNAT family N-acetyltransferase [Luteipulveratus halotolerans]|uniref:N-acetyltransferase domain-containing protein n=1 Tax=Luteipulveratus halotolerans TaxID=1631356 RepID=A0A0L6CJ71_9MICO|nr:GNAT family N-acetyltransferase [Luteipulveratus halotolerans]KNX37655.1 hypothetical protein VV01_11680 [Luteipulveratus halotolerans]
MTAPSWQSVPLSESHVSDTFACGVDPLDRWLQVDAWRAQQAGAARTFVWVTAGSSAVVAYFSLAPTQVSRGDVSRGLGGGYSHVPGYLLARLALDTSLHGQGLGAQLLVDALERVVAAADRAGGRLIVVDPIDDTAAAFYERFDFRHVEQSTRMYMKVATARAALAPRSRTP